MTLRNRLIRLAHAKPELRDHLLPLLREASFEDEVEGKKFKNPETGNQVSFDSLPADEQKKIRDKFHEKGEGADKKEPHPLNETAKKIIKELGHGRHNRSGTPAQMKKLEAGLQKMEDSGLKFDKDTILELSQGSIDGDTDAYEAKYKKYKGHAEVSKILNEIYEPS